jgi:solute carrier family 13 (sodium-dependent dicarboxylate transporter), member 2/3/5
VVTEAIPIPMTALVGVVLCALLEATPPPPEDDTSVDVVFALFTDDTVMLFIGSFIIAQAMVVHGLHRRLAFRVLSLSWVGGNTYRIILAFGLIGALTSPVMSNTAGAAMMLPIALGVMGDHLQHHRRRPAAPHRQPAQPDRTRTARGRDR